MGASGAATAAGCLDVVTPVSISAQPGYHAPMSKSLVLHADRLFPADPNPARDRTRALRRACGPSDPQSPRTHRSGLVRATTSRSATRPSCCSPPTTICSACSTARGSTWRGSGWPRVRGPSSADPREAWRLFAEPFLSVPRNSVGALARSRFQRGVRAGGGAGCSDRGLRTSTRSAQRCAPMRFGRGRCSSDSTSRCWQRPSRPSTVWSRIGRSARAAGQAGSSPPIVPMPVVDPEHEHFRCRAGGVRRVDGRGCVLVGRLSAGASRAARSFRQGRRHCHRPRPSDRTHGRSGSTTSASGSSAA